MSLSFCLSRSLNCQRDFDEKSYKNQLQVLMKVLASSIISSENSIQYEYRSKLDDYLAKKSAGTQEDSHIQPH